MRLIENGCVTISGTSAGEACAVVEELVARGAGSILLLAADGNDCRPEDFDPWLARVQVPIFGGAFPQLIFDRKNQEHGYVVLGLRDRCRVVSIDGLSSEGTDFSASIEAAFGGSMADGSVMVLVDGLASQIGSFLEGVYDVLGGDISYFGGGAGSLSFQHKPCLFANGGMLHDHALLVVMPDRMAVGVEHGWQKFAGPFAVTDAARNIVTSLEYRPAFDVYRELVEADSGRSFAAEDFFAIAKGYPLGMEKPDGTIVVRDPITCEGTALVCVGEVPANSVVYLLKGQPERLIEAAASSARKIPAGSTPVFLVDCISRVLYLQERFGEEVRAVQQEIGERALVGILTLGEIANGGDYCLEFYNKTLVLAAVR